MVSDWSGVSSEQSGHGYEGAAAGGLPETVGARAARDRRSARGRAGHPCNLIEALRFIRCAGLLRTGPIDAIPAVLRGRIEQEHVWLSESRDIRLLR